MRGDQALMNRGWRCGLLAYVLTLFSVATLAHAADTGLLTTAAEVHRLTPRESASGLPVKLRGVITYVRGVGPDLAFQDHTGGVLLDWFPESGSEPLHPGMELEIEGVTGVNPPTPRVKVLRLEVLGNPGLPTPRVATVSELLTADVEASYVEFTAVLRSVRVEEAAEPHRLALAFGPVSSRLTVWVSRWNEETKASYHPGATLRVRGVLLRWKTQDFLPYSTFAVVHDPSGITVMAPASSTSERPLMTIPEALTSRSLNDASLPLRVRGVVTLDRSPQGLVIQDDEAAIWVRPLTAGSFQPGDLVDVTAFPGTNGARKELEDAEIVWVDRAPLPRALELSPSEFNHNRPQWKDGHLVRVQGVVRQSSVSDAGVTHWLDFGRSTLPLQLPLGSDPPSLAGSMVEATGVLEAHLNQRILRTGWGLSDYELHLQGPANLKVIAPPPWWTRQRLLAALGSIIAVAGGSALWALSLRRRVMEKSAQLAREITARHDQELLAEERQRLARDLHDTLEQTLTGASLQLDAVEALQPVAIASKPGEPFQLARRLLDRSRDELRRAVWDLTPGLLEQRGLPNALAAMAEERSRGGEVTITIECDESAEGLPDRLAAHLCRVAQEATSNAIRHGRAKHIAIELKVATDSVEILIKDDGVGFNTDNAAGIQTGHFGINGMKERLRRLNGECEIHSRPGEGTIVRARCPIGTGPSHESTRLDTLP
jgi:signal transduction histidine kinase